LCSAAGGATFGNNIALSRRRFALMSGMQHISNPQEIQVKTLRNFALGAAAAAAFGIGAAAAQEPAKPAAKPETAHRHGAHHGQQGCHQGAGEKHHKHQGHGQHEKDEKHEHTPR
jgi:hypothetical protein